MKVYITLIMYQGLVYDVSAWAKPDDAEMYFKEETGNTEQDQKALDEHNELNDYSGSCIYVCDLIEDQASEANMLDELMKAIDNLEDEGKEEHEGSKIDLARVLRAIVIIYQDKGIGYVIRTLKARRLIDQAKQRK